MEIIGYLASIIIGLSLGLIGGGGSILAVPILVYLFNVHPEQATSYSLFIVGLTSMIGSYSHYQLGNLKIKSALVFAVPSILSLLFIRKMVLHLIPDTLFFINEFEITKNLLIMVVFAFLMIATSVSMIKKSKPQLETVEINLPMKQAVGTSLFIIFINSLIGFGGDLLGGVHLDFQLLFIISIMAIIGLFIGTQLSKKIDGAKLKPAFGWFVLIMGIYIIAKEIIFK